MNNQEAINVERMRETLIAAIKGMSEDEVSELITAAAQLSLQQPSTFPSTHLCSFLRQKQ